MLNKILVFLLIFITGNATGATVVTGGLSVDGTGTGQAEGQSFVCSTDPAITLGIRSSSSTFGPGSFSFERSGSQNVEIPLGGYMLSVGFNGTVSSSISTSESGSLGYTSSYVGATATGISTGHTIEGSESYDLFGSADIITEGYLYGAGTGTAAAKGSSEYRAIRIGTPSEVWGQVAGESRLMLDGRSSSSFSTTGSTPNGLHAESRIRETILEEKTGNSLSRITTFGSVANDASADVFAAGLAESGGWNSDAREPKVRGVNENVASSSEGEISGSAESNGYLDASSVSSVIQSSSVRDPRLYVSGGPASYAASSQVSSSSETNAEISVKNSKWGSVARGEGSQIAFQAGNLTDLRSEVQVDQAGAGGISFGKVLLYADYQVARNLTGIAGNLSLDTYSEATKNSTAFAATDLGPFGNGTLSSGDDRISGEAGFSGNLTSLSMVNSSEVSGRAANIVEMTFATTNPPGTEWIDKPVRVDTTMDPIVAWARTDGGYRLAQ